MDYWIKGGSFPNFDKGCFQEADIKVESGKIAAVCPVGTDTGDAKVINAVGRIVSPGFIDMHAHEEDLKANNGVFDITRLQLAMGVTTCIAGNCGIQYQSLKRLKAFIVENGGAPLNILMLAGYGSFRNQIGLGYYDKASPEQVEQMIALVKNEAAEGALGVSFGLEYYPGITTADMVQTVNALDGDPFVSIHFRADCEHCMESLEEMAYLARETGCRIQLSHLSSMAGTGLDNMENVLALLAKERDPGSRLDFDTYPYDAFCTSIGSAVFDMDWREEWGKDYDDIFLVQGPYKNQRCTAELYPKLRSEYPDMNVVVFAMQESAIQAAVADKNGMYGSDGGIMNGGGHPRSAGTFPRILGKYVREEKRIELLPALQKMTLRAAQRVGLQQCKGKISEGYDADIVIFDAETIMDRATFTDPFRGPSGIDYVIVDGKISMDHGVETGVLAGSFIGNASEKLSGDHA